MSLVFDKGKYKYLDLDQLKLKNNNKKANQIKKISQKLNINSNKNSQLSNQYEGLSPIRNINNDKKSTFLTNFHNYSNYVTINSKHPIYNMKKKKISQKLKYNKSFEGNLLNNDLMASNNLGIGNNDSYSITQRKNYENKKLYNNSVILNNNKQNKTKTKTRYNNKSITRSINSQIYKDKNNRKSLDQNLIVTKLDDKFKSLESNIIDKQYEDNIDNDEMIISSYKKNINYPNTITTRVKTKNKIYNNNLKLSDVLDEANNLKINKYNDEKKENIFLNLIEDKNNKDFDENYLLNTSFENNRNDFEIMYTDNYDETVMDDMLSLEIKLLIEKMIEIQKSYHKELNLIVRQYNKNRKIFRILIEKIKSFHKKIYLIRKMQETKNINGNINKFLGAYNQNSQHESNKINENEFTLWKIIFNKNEKRHDKYNKEIIKDLFKKVIFDKYYKLSGNLNNIENQIILNLMKKYKYNINLNKKNNRIKSNISNGNIISKNDKNLAFSTSPFQATKKNIKYSKGNQSTTNNKKKHKKTSSCFEAKPNKIIYFKNSKK
jgi:hypothetical protein